MSGDAITLIRKHEFLKTITRIKFLRWIDVCDDLGF